MAFLLFLIIMILVWLCVLTLALATGQRELRGRVNELEQYAGQVHGDDWTVKLRIGRGRSAGSVQTVNIRASTEAAVVKELLRRGVDTKDIIAIDRTSADPDRPNTAA